MFTPKANSPVVKTTQIPVFNDKITTFLFFLLKGQHDCVAIINNFFPRERLDYYTKPQGLDKEPKLPPKLAGPLHKIITTTNLHPVKVAWCLPYLLFGSGCLRGFRGVVIVSG